MKRALLILVFIAVGFIGYYAGLNHQCTNIVLNNDYSFTCDGRKIQGPTYTREWPVHTWEFHTTVK